MDSIRFQVLVAVGRRCLTKTRRERLRKKVGKAKWRVKKW
jgi:hypothetical protein